MSSGDSTPVLTVTTDDAAGTSIPSPYLLQADVSMWATFVQVIQQEFCGDFFFFFLVMLPSEIPELSTDPIRERVS